MERGILKKNTNPTINIYLGPLSFKKNKRLKKFSFMTVRLFTWCGKYHAGSLGFMNFAGVVGCL